MFGPLCLLFIVFERVDQSDSRVLFSVGVGTKRGKKRFKSPISPGFLNSNVPAFRREIVLAVLQ